MSAHPPQPERRRCLQRMVAAALVPLASAAARAQPAPADAAPAYADAAAADEWMQAWVVPAQSFDPGTHKPPNGMLHLGRFADPVYYLTSIVGWDPEAAQAAQYRSVRVPVGFVTDFASIPRVFWSLLRPDGLTSYAAVIHDHLYWEQYLSRETSDMIFRLCMEDFRIEPAVIHAVHAAVRLGGGTAWDDNARRKAGGEQRVLKRLPTDPRIRWAQWRAEPGVF